LAIAPADEPSARESSFAAPKKSRHRSTSHLKEVPETKALREQIRARAVEVVGTIDKTRPLNKTKWRPSLVGF